MKPRMFALAITFSAMLIFRGQQIQPVDATPLHDIGYWTLDSLPDDWVGLWLADIDMVSPTDGWAVGARGVLHYQDSAWRRKDVPQGGDSLRSIDMVSPTDGWAVGSRGLILHFDGTDWREVPSQFRYSQRTYYAIDMVSPTDGWIVGSSGTILEYNGTSWQEISSPSGAMITQVDMVSPTDGWAVGDGGLILHYDGSLWNIVPPPGGHRIEKTILMSIDMVSPTDGWIVGGKSFLHYNGIDWQVVSSPATGSLVDVRMLSEEEGWAVGVDILHYINGGWEITVAPSTRCTDGDVSFTGVAPVARNQARVVGACGGLVAHYVREEDGASNLAEAARNSRKIWIPFAVKSFSTVGFE